MSEQLYTTLGKLIYSKMLSDMHDGEVCDGHLLNIALVMSTLGVSLSKANQIYTLMRESHGIEGEQHEFMGKRNMGK